MAAHKPSSRVTHLAPTLLSNGIQVSIVDIPRILRHEMSSVLPDVDLSSVRIVPTAQKSRIDLVNVGAEVAEEKDRLLETFTKWAEKVRDIVTPSGFWVDYVDPCSGLPVYSKNANIIYPEVDTFELLLKYRSESAGPCKILLHPDWGSHCYPATLFSNAPISELVAAMETAASHA